MTAEHKYEMTISLQIVEHLGLNLSQQYICSNF